MLYIGMKLRVIHRNHKMHHTYIIAWIDHFGGTFCQVGRE